MFSGHTHDVKVYKIIDKNEEDNATTTYILETFEVNSPDLVYYCHLNTKTLKGKAYRLVLEYFNPKPNFDVNQDENVNEIQNILDKCMPYNIVVAIFEQSFPQYMVFFIKSYPISS